MAVTIKDLARETGLGLATISSYLNGGNVREKNRIKIEAAIKTLDFAVNETARNLRTNKSMTVGIMVPDFKSSFFSNTSSEIEDILRRHGYSVIISDCRTDVAREKEVAEFFMRKRVDGIINAPVDYTGEHLRPFLQSGKPVVLIDRIIEQFECDSVSIDNVDAVRQAVYKLVDNGHKYIGYIGPSQKIYTSAQRCQGFRLGMAERGLLADERFIVETSGTVQGGHDACIALLKKYPQITAIIATDDKMTVGCMVAVNELKRVVPEDISILGFDNVDFALACSPGLDIVTQPFPEIARCAVDLMLRRLSGSATPAETVILATSLQEGQSVQNLNANIL